MTVPTTDQIRAALAGVEDPEIHRPITDLGMVESVAVDQEGVAEVTVLLTIATCPMRDELSGRIRAAVAAVPGVTEVALTLGVMSEEQRKGLRTLLQGEERDNPFVRPGSRTRVYAIASGKGGVGKSSVTVNLAVALAARGLSVGLIDADIYGHSVPRMIGVTESPTAVEGMLFPPVAHGVRVISMLPFKPGGVTQAVAFRGPMLHRALNQFLTDVFWGDLDVLLLDLPPGTGDIAISVAQLLPGAELVVVTTPQAAAAEVAVRAGMLAQQTKQRVAGVIENMSALPCPHCGEPIDLFGSGGGQMAVEALTRELGTAVPLLGRVPFDVRLREGGDAGMPLVISDPTSPAGTVLHEIAADLGVRPRGLVGTSLGLTPAGRR